MKKIVIKQFEIPRHLRVIAITLLIILVIISLYGTLIAFQLSDTVKDTVITAEYRHSGNFNYLVYLKNNSVYNISILYPGRGIIFKKITDHIDGTFTYRFHCDNADTIQGTYTVNAHLTSDLWEKDYLTVPLTTFSSSGEEVSFSTEFPIDYAQYESIVNNINSEIGVSSGNPTLHLQCIITIDAETKNSTITDRFSPSLSIPLGNPMIDINGDLLQTKAGFIEETEIIPHQGVAEQRTSWIIFLFIVAFILLLLVVLTSSKVGVSDKVEKLVKKIRKKYGEWIVEVEKPPKRSLGSEVVDMKSVEDLIKVGEELGRPVLYHKSSTEQNTLHMFYVLDESFQYKYVLSGAALPDA